ncbi:hypothetical protein GCM10027589_51010 [Actinocorallia lasiicapitis]
MPSLVQRIQAFLRSPQGRTARAHAERLARDPRTKSRLQALKTRLTTRRHH